MNINVVDLVLAGVLILAIVYGWRWGTINVVAKVGALVLAYDLARTYSSVFTAFLVDMLPPLGGAAGSDTTAESGQQLLSLLSLFIDTESVANRLLGIIVFIIIFIIVNWIVRRIAYALTGLFGRGLLGKINRAVGAFLSLVLMMAIIVIFDDIVLPTFIDMGFGTAIQEYLDRSALIMPFIRSLPSIL